MQAIFMKKNYIIIIKKINATAFLLFFLFFFFLIMLIQFSEIKISIIMVKSIIFKYLYQMNKESRLHINFNKLYLLKVECDT
jgi:hypothetical protein